MRGRNVDRDEARQRAELLRPILAELAGMTARAIARELNEREVPLPGGGPWHAMTVILAMCDRITTRFEFHGMLHG